MAYSPGMQSLIEKQRKVSPGIIYEAMFVKPGVLCAVSYKPVSFLDLFGPIAGANKPYYVIRSLANFVNLLIAIIKSEIQNTNVIL